MFLVAALLAISAPARAQPKPVATYPDTEAAVHVGEEAAVTGKVVAVSKSAGGLLYLNFGERFPRQTFSGVVFTRDQEKVGDVQIYEGKVVTITGRIEAGPNQKPQIVISAPGQVKLGEPPAPPPVVAQTPAMPAPPGAPPAKPRRAIILAPRWNSPTQGGEMTRRDLAMLFGTLGKASEETAGDPAMMIFGDITFLLPLAEARKRLKLEGATSSEVKVATPGLPLGSFSAHFYQGVFEGGFNRLALITDGGEQVVSVLLVHDNPRARTGELTDVAGYHTYNFINHRVKGAKDLLIKHEAAATPAGLVVVESRLIDPTDPDLAAPQSRTSTRTATPRTSRTGKVLEYSRWYVPRPVVNLILRCVGNR